MATINILKSFGDTWPPDVLVGGAIIARSSATMTYVSEMGFTVKLRGTGLVYDADGNASGGIVTRVTLSLGGVTYLDATGLNALLPRLTMWAFGFDRGPEFNVQSPDPFQFYQYLVRGRDTINGSAEADELTGGRGADVIHAGAGADFITADAGNDVIDGGDGRDTLNFDQANWDVAAYRGVSLDTQSNLATDSWGGTDTITNIEKFRDTIYNDTLRGNATDETFYLTRGKDIVDGRLGFDIVSYEKAALWSAHHGVNVNLATGLAQDSWGSTDRLSHIEGVIGTSFNDTLTGSGADEYFAGGKGVDAVAGGAGFDWLGFWPAQDDTSGHGIIINLTKAAIVQDDGFGNVESATGIDGFEGTSFADRFTGNALDNTFWGNAGNDTLLGGDGGDDLRGGVGNDSVAGGAGSDTIAGNEGADRLIGNEGADHFEFSAPPGTGVDLITDMQAGVDSIWIDINWGGGLTLANLSADQFLSGAQSTAAATGAQRVIYNTTTGNLYFDVDGVGGAAAVKFATLANHAAITFADIHILV